jgi:tetratricopeptide (TPR) repeat protein
MKFKEKREQLQDYSGYLLFFILLVCSCSSSGSKRIDSMHARVQKLIDDGQLQIANSLVDSCLVIAPDDARLHFQKSLCLDIVKEYENIQQELNLAEQYLDVDSCTLLRDITVQRGHVYKYNGKIDDAFDSYLEAHTIAMRCSPTTTFDSLSNLLNAGSMAARMGKFAVSDSIARELVFKFPQEIDGYDLRATSLRLAKNYENAIKAYDTILAKFAGDTTINLGYTYFERGLAKFALKGKELACPDWEKAATMGVQWAIPKLDSFCTKTK